MELTLLGLAAVLIIAWLYLRKRGAAAKEREVTNASPQQDTSYHAVSIRFSEGACAAAKGMTGRRFLSNAAPRLPLPECDAAVCECRFAHHKDRRSGKDRRSPFASGRLAGSTGRYEAERREGIGRRKTDDTGSFEI